MHVCVCVRARACVHACVRVESADTLCLEAVGFRLVEGADPLGLKALGFRL